MYDGLSVDGIGATLARLRGGYLRGADRAFLSEAGDTALDCRQFVDVFALNRPGFIVCYHPANGLPQMQRMLLQNLRGLHHGSVGPHLKLGRNLVHGQMLQGA